MRKTLIKMVNRQLAANGRVILAVAIMTGYGATLALAAANPPVVTGRSPTKDTTPTWTWSTGGGGLGKYRYKLENTGLWSTVTPSTTFTPATALTEGRHVLFVQEKDGTGKWSASGLKAIVVDLTPPNAPVVGGDSPTIDQTPAWFWVSGGGGGLGKYRYKLDDSNMKTGTTLTSKTNFTPGNSLAAGIHTLYVQERDKAGNWSAKGSMLVEIIAEQAQTGHLPDTGQTQSYTDTFGEDSDYSYFPPSYTDNLNGTVTDNVTGLMWQQQNSELGLNHNAAIAFCQDLALADFADWRLPSKKELGSIVHYGHDYPTIDTTAFPNPYQFSYWTSTTLTGSSEKAWAVTFNSGDLYTWFKTEEYRIRCVRGNQAVADLVDNSDGTVTDNNTGLTWQQIDNKTDRTWNQAILYCENLTLAGKTDWRLPNIKELESITDDYHYGPAIDTTAFPDTNSSLFWSSTTPLSNTTGAYVINFLDGASNSIVGKNDFWYGQDVRCVRGGQ